MHFPGEQSFLGINYCLLAARSYIYISAKNKLKTISVLFPNSIFFKKQARDRQREDSRPCYSLEHLFVLVLFSFCFVLFCFVFFF